MLQKLIYNSSVMTEEVRRNVYSLVQTGRSSDFPLEAAPGESLRTLGLSYITFHLRLDHFEKRLKVCQLNSTTMKGKITFLPDLLENIPLQIMQ